MTNSISQELNFIKVAQLKRNVTLSPKLAQRILYLLVQLNKTYEAIFPARESMAATFGTHVKKISQTTNELQELGIIVKTRRFNKSNVYTLHPYFSTKDGIAFLKKLRLYATFALSFLFVPASSIHASDQNVPLSKCNYNNTSAHTPCSHSNFFIKKRQQVSQGGDIAKEETNCPIAGHGGSSENTYCHDCDETHANTSANVSRTARATPNDTASLQKPTVRGEVLDNQDLLVGLPPYLHSSLQDNSRGRFAARGEMYDDRDDNDSAWKRASRLKSDEHERDACLLTCKHPRSMTKEEFTAFLEQYDARKIKKTERESSMSIFTEAELLALTQYSKHVLAEANKKLTQDLHAGKSISDHFAYFKGICESIVAHETLKREKPKIQVSVAARPVVEFKPKQSEERDSASELRTVLAYVKANPNDNEFLRERRQDMIKGHINSVVRDYGEQVAAEILNEYSM